MENYRYERVKKICEDLRGLITVQSVAIPSFQMKKGLFLRPSEVDAHESDWVTFNPETDFWPGPDEHYWFRAEIEVPASFDKKPLWLSFVTQTTFWDAVNPQFLLFINGEVVQGLDTNHREVKLTDKAKAGDKFLIDLQAYTGRDNDHNRGTTSNLRLFSEMIEIDPSINEVFYNLETPNRIVSHLDKNNQSRIKLQIALEKAINLLDLRVPYSKEFYASVKECNAFLKDEVYGKLAGNDDVIATCIGHTHIDVAWWWTVEQTKEKVVRSFATVLKLMEEFDDYKFMSSQPQIYKFLKQRYPELFAKIQERVKEGRWETEGGMWLEADCNVTSGESLVRQFLHGKKFFKEEFNQDNKILWLPDVFGYSAALPQILRKSGIDYFMTTKIAWNQFNKLPMDTFWWKGIDGSEVFTHLITTQDVEQPKDSFYTTYNGKLDPICLMRAWDRYQQKDINNDVLISYGYGDGGGGPTREMIEHGVRMEKGITGAPKVRMESSRKYFDELYDRCADNKNLPRWVGELYLEYHRGTYTSMARNKRSNRKCELLWQDVEFFSVFAERLGLEYNAEEIYNSWEVILMNQFHDILPGSSIKEVYEVTKVEYEALESRANEIINEKVKALANAVNAKENDLVVFNSLSFDRDDAVIVDACGYEAVTAFKDQEGNILPVVKTTEGKLSFVPEFIPAKGYAVFTPVTEAVAVDERISVDGNEIDTPFYHITLDDACQFTSLFDKDANREVLKVGENGNVLRVYEDKPIYYDNWDIDIYYNQKSWVVDDVISMEWEENNSVRAVLKVVYKFLDSTITQRVIFYTNSRRIDFDTTVDWKQFNLLLKCEFPVDVNAIEATYDIQFGNIKRPTHKNTSWDCAKFEVCGHKWADLSEGGFGVALLNDCKYGYGITEGKMTLSLVKSGNCPNPTTDQEMHYFTYALLPHDEFNADEIAKEAYCLNVPTYGVKVTAPEAKLGFDSLVAIDVDNVMIETVKKAEDGNGFIIRMYEFENKRTNATITIGAGCTSVSECDLMENDIDTIDVNDSEFNITIKPYEIKTYRIQ
ncbi:alpha-mannosidase [Paludicola sp. MB14-C6]|uniref:alpha-mannosidase n=1 Tax=Paludihabitans sp. MB14-C6 TaxID=3070656 RepID=UPI0027DC7298|nr:alpha-mannosidase [Paludicola sp. MB14-C6]WMJ24077.1 alpha-mannosidase [Paludicola sp. MB14-C6]